MNQPFYGEQAKPDLPVDRVRAAITIMTLANAQTSFTSLLAAVDPAIRPAGIAQINVGSGDWSKLTEARDQAEVTLARVDGYLDQFAAGRRPSSITDAKDRFGHLDSLMRQHRKAQLSGYLTTIEKAEVDKLLSLIDHRRELGLQLQTALGVSAPGVDAAVQAMAPNIEAARRLVARGLGDVGAAHELEGSRRAGESELLDRLARLSALPGKLDVKAMTLEEAGQLASACDKIAARGERVTLAMREPGIEDDGLIASLAARCDKIINAGKILDQRFGTAWRLQPIEKLVRAADIANTADDPRHAKVFEYARSFGIDAKIQQSLDGAAKTQRATERLKSDAALLQAFPTTFKGLDTDLELLREAAEFVRELRSDLSRVRGGAALLSVFRTNSRRVMAEFIGYANLHIDIDAIGCPPQTAIEDVYGLYRNDLVELKEDIDFVEACNGRDVADLIGLAALAEAVVTTEASVINNQHYIACGAYDPLELSGAVQWTSDVTAITGETPRGDEDLARLAIVARDAQRDLDELASLIDRVCRMLGHPSADDIEFSAIRPFLATVEALRDVVTARALVCRSAEEAERSGLHSFVADVSAIAPANWGPLLDERYALLDKLMADDAFAVDLSAAADAADAAAGAPEATSSATRLPESAPGWIEEDIFLLPTAKQTEAA